MTLAQAQLEFQIRRYRWAKSKAAEEVREKFPNFWLFKGGLTWEMYHFMRQLEANKLDLFVAALLKRDHREAAKALGETIGTHENALLNQFYSFRAFSPFEKDMAAKKRVGQKFHFASKRSVKKKMMLSFEKAFGHMGPEGFEEADSQSANLRVRFKNWIVQTNFFFGRSQSLIRFDHFVSHPILFSAPGAVKDPFLDASICWISLGVMEWNYLMTEDIEPACDSVIGLCREFFNELPKFLEGLDVENVTIDQNS
jgi:hypothetical protein